MRRFLVFAGSSLKSCPQLEELPPESVASEEYCGVYQAFRDIAEAAEKARDAGERMENRLFQYSTAVKSLGFERVRT